MAHIENLLAGMPGNEFRLRKVRPQTYQLIAPIFHEDGDMMNIYLEESDDGIRITDHGMSLMRLSYLIDVDTDNKKKILNDIVLARNAELREGSIESTVRGDDLFPYIMNYAQLVAEVCNMDILSRETVANVFYDDLRDAVESLGTIAHCIPDYQPEGFSHINVDYAFLWDKARKPIYMFGIKDTNKALQTTISCLQMELKQVPGKTIAVFDDIDALTRKSRINLLNAVGKAFDLEGFKEKGKLYIEEELGVA